MLQEGNQAVIPILSKYMSDWKDKMQHQFEQMRSGPAKTTRQTDGPISR